MNKWWVFLGSHGGIVVDSVTGGVIDRIPKTEGGNDFGYLDVIRLDVAEFREWAEASYPNMLEDNNFDILDIGVHYADGDFEPPDLFSRSRGWNEVQP